MERRLRSQTLLVLASVTAAAFSSLAFGQDCRIPDVQKIESKSYQDGDLMSLSYVTSFTAEQLNGFFGSIVGPAENAIDAYRVTYNSSYRDRTDLELSGMIYVPGDCKSQYPSVFLQHGTIVDNASAPSLNPSEGLVEALKGFFTIVPDYYGYGSSVSDLHPYLIADSYAKSGVDLLKAVQSLEYEQQSNYLSQLFLKGYSEGGYATLALQKLLESDFKDEFPIAASAPTAGPYNMLFTAYQSLAGEFTNPVFTGYTVAAYMKYYPQDYTLSDVMPVSQFMNLEYLFSGDFTFSQVIKLLPSQVSRLIGQDFRTSFLTDIQALLQEGRPLQNSFSLALAQNNLDRGWSIQSQTRFFHCSDDDVVPLESTLRIVQTLGQDNPLVSYEAIESPEGQPPYNHGNCPAILSPVFWFKSLLAN